jgi:hypothetical protein
MKPKEQMTPDELENEAFNQNKFEAFGLQLKEKSGTITPVEQERLGVLQAKMDDYWAQRLERAKRFGHDFSKIPVHPPEGYPTPKLQPLWRQATPGVPLGGQRSLSNFLLQSSASPIQPKLTIGQPGDKNEQEAARVASQVVEQINAPASAQPTQGQSLQRQEEKKEELQAKSTLKSGQELAGGEASDACGSTIHFGMGSVGMIQRKLEFKQSSDVITQIEFTKRPGWSRAVKVAMPSIKGFDRGHLIPWMAIRLQIERNLFGKKKQEAFNWLKDQGHEPESLTWPAIENAIKEFGQEQNSDLDNLEYEDSSINRSNGAKLPQAAAIWLASFDEDGYKWKPPYDVTNSKGVSMKLTTRKAARDWCISVGVSEGATTKQKEEARERFSESPCAVM